MLERDQHFEEYLNHSVEQEKIATEEIWAVDEYKGREIAGLEVTPERFAVLEKGRDYTIEQLNPNITADRSVENFFVFISPSQGTEIKFIEPPHWRTISESGIHSKLDLGNGQGDHYYTVNTKGVGYLKLAVKGKNIEEYTGTWAKPDEHELFNHKTYGLSSEGEYPDAMVATAENLTRQGLRTEMPWAVAELHNICYRGQLTSVAKLKERGILLNDPDYKPYMGVRLMKTNTRIAEASEADSRRERLFNEAFDVYNREVRDSGLNLPELVIDEVIDQKKFIEIFFQRMASNMAVLLNTGYYHSHLHSANVTLAAEIVDVITMTQSKSESDPVYSGLGLMHIKDMRDIAYGLKTFLKATKKASFPLLDPENLEKGFLATFSKKLDPKLRHPYIKPQNAKRWMQKIFNAVIVEGWRLPSLQYNSIETDWGHVIDIENV